MSGMLQSTDCGRGGKVVQLMGGVGTAETQYHATRLLQKLASLIGAEPVLLQAPGVVESIQARRVLSRDISVRQATDLFDRIDLALIGIGSMEPSSFLVSRSEERRVGKEGRSRSAPGP